MSEDQLHWTIRYLLFDLSSLFFSVFTAQGGAEALKTFAERLKQLLSSFEKARAAVLASLKTEKFDYAALPLLSSFSQVLLVSLLTTVALVVCEHRLNSKIKPKLTTGVWVVSIGESPLGHARPRSSQKEEGRGRSSPRDRKKTTHSLSFSRSPSAVPSQSDINFSSNKNERLPKPRQSSRRSSHS